MKRGRWTFGFAAALGSCAWISTTMLAQTPEAQRPDRDQLQQPVFRVAQQQAQAAAPRVANNTLPAQNNNIPVPNSDHPLAPALQMAYDAMKNIRANVKDYSATMIKQERIGTKLGDKE